VGYVITPSCSTCGSVQQRGMNIACVSHASIELKSSFRVAKRAQTPDSGCYFGISSQAAWSKHSTLPLAERRLLQRIKPPNCCLDPSTVSDGRLLQVRGRNQLYDDLHSQSGGLGKFCEPEG